MKKEHLADCPFYLRDYLTYCRAVKNRTENTVEAYFIDLRTFLRYIKIRNGDAKESDFDSLSISDVPISYLMDFSLLDAYEYVNYLIDVRKNNGTTRSRKISALKRFFDYLANKAMLIPKNSLEQLESPKLPEKLPKYLELDQSVKLLDDIESKNTERDFCIITLFLNCGMRLSELVGLNLSDYSESLRSLRLFGKGRKERIVYLNDACINALNSYLEIRPKSSAEPNAIFVSQYGGQVKRLSNRRVQRIIEDQLKRAGLGNLGISTHKLRHTAATLMYEYGHVDTLVLKEVLGHKSVATTQIYTHLSDSDKRRAAENNPLANFSDPQKSRDDK